MENIFDMYDIKSYDEIPNEVMKNGIDANYENEHGKITAKVYNDEFWIINMELSDES